MANSITSHIPNFVTCCNLFSGCIASVMAFQGDYQSAILFIILGAVFDFFDGMLARLFNVSGPLGKELDSLADDITFGFAPSAIVFSLFKEVHYPSFLEPIATYLPYTAFIIAIFSTRSPFTFPRSSFIVHRSPFTLHPSPLIVLKFIPNGELYIVAVKVNLRCLKAIGGIRSS